MTQIPATFTDPIPAQWSQYGQRPLPLGMGSFLGIPFGPGLNIQIMAGYTGIDETPDQVRNDQQKGAADGTYSARAYTGPRTVTLPFAVLADSQDEMQYILATLEMVWDPDGETWERLWLFDNNRFLNAQITKREFVQNLGGRGQATAKGTVQFYAADPYWYGPDTPFLLRSLTTSGGMQFPMDFPMTMGAPGQGNGVVYNPGLRTPVRMSIPGPITHPFLGSDTAGVGLDLNITLSPTDILTVDSSGGGSIMLNGTARRNELVTGQSAFFDLMHGNNVLRLRSASGGANEIANGAFNPRWR